MRSGFWVGPVPIGGASSLDEGGLALDLVKSREFRKPLKGQQPSMVSHPVLIQAMFLNTFLLVGLSGPTCTPSHELK